MLGSARVDGELIVDGGIQTSTVLANGVLAGVVEGDAVQQEKLFRWETPRGQPAYAGKLTASGARPSALVQRLEAAGGFQWDRDVGTAADVGNVRAMNGNGSGGRS